MKNYINCIVILILLFVSFSCSDDKNEIVFKDSVSLTFSYTNNMQGVDKFTSEISKVNIYVFDEYGCFIEEYNVNTAELKDKQNSYDIDLKPGKYDFIIWGNLSESYNLCKLEKGVTNFEDCYLSLKCKGNVLDSQPNSLFYGAVYGFEVREANRKRPKEDLQVNIEMIKNTKSIRFIAKNFPINNINESSYNCMITAMNGSYKFDNTVKKAEKLNYLSKVQVTDKKELMFDFVIIGDFKNTLYDSKLIFSQNDLNGQKKDILNKSLYDLLIPLSITGNLDIEDAFEIEIMRNDYD